jgi:hypothetical protein
MPKNRKQYKTDQDFVILKLNKSDGSEFKFVVTFEKLKNKSNKGTFAVNGKRNHNLLLLISGELKQRSIHQSILS